MYLLKVGEGKVTLPVCQKSVLVIKWNQSEKKTKTKIDFCLRLLAAQGVKAWVLKLMENDIQIFQLTFKVIRHLYNCM